MKPKRSKPKNFRMIKSDADGRWYEAKSPDDGKWYRADGVRPGLEIVMQKKRSKPFPAGLASTKMLEASGWTVGTVEQSMAFGKVRFKRDLFNFADLIAVSPGRGIMLVQVTGSKDSTNNFHQRLRKVKEEPRAAIWLAAGGRIEIHSWETSVPKQAPGDWEPWVWRGRWCRIFEVQAESTP